MWRSAGLALAAVVALAGCGAPAPAPAAWQVVLATEVGADGRSPELRVEVPAGARSLAIVVDGDPAVRYALAALTPPHDAARSAPVPALDGRVAGPLRQVARRGRFSFAYPTAPGERLLAGTASFRVAADRPGPVVVRVLVARAGIGGARLHVDLVRVTGAAGAVDEHPAWLAEAARILAQAGVELVVDRRATLIAPALARITEHAEPDERPDSQAGRLAAAVAALPGGALALDAVPDVYVVDELPAGVGGLALAVPGPPVPGLYTGIVTEAGGTAAQRGRVVAHELAHYLGLAHVEDGAFDDGLPDTAPGAANLMAPAGEGLTPGQIQVLRASPLLR